ncbi:thiamine diphosphokinase [Clostridium aminobutyricum]|uniref:Thiamine diphosphokinase n=1 Tax=Clostridium aminobutyricum TaxID=33953 RepID=A0A939D6V4_CLOAM|nr:thiamine diphosphokinase [Clostridium aminobutyricum]MBN7772160.1 thiamine diphosphokinase [Clostridium aminobutyricum]
MSRCIIITAYLEGRIKDSIEIQKNDFIICADGGYRYAKKEKITPHLLIGDLDSFTEKLPDEIQIIKHPVEKDDTDTMLCIKHAVQHNFDEIVLIGGMGGRIDHTLSNLQSMSWTADYWTSQNDKHKISMRDAKNQVIILQNNSILLEGNIGDKISLISYSEKCSGIFTQGLKWPLSDATLTNSFPVGISNEFTDTAAAVSVEEGKLLIVLSKD